MQDPELPNLDPKTEAIKHRSRKLAKLLLIFTTFALFVAFIISLTSFISLRYFCNSEEPVITLNKVNPFKDLIKDDFEMNSFSSPEEFKEYIQEVESYGYGLFSRNLTGASVDISDVTIPSEVTSTGLSSLSVGFGSASRTSTTNVQVAAVDEPDIVKAVDNTLFTSFRKSIGGISYYELDPNYEMYIPPINPQDLDETNIINAFPPSEMQKIGSINKIGQLLYAKDVLVVFTNESVFGYDVSNKSAPNEVWSYTYEKGTKYKNSRLYNDEVYLISETRFNYSEPCPIQPFSSNDQYKIDCSSIYHPEKHIAVDSTYNIYKIDIKTGKIKDSVSLVAASYGAVIYMSKDNIYITYSDMESEVSILMDFFRTEGAEVLPPEVIEKLDKLEEYDISESAKMIEFFTYFERYESILGDEENDEISEIMEKKMEIYEEKHKRDFQSTGIVKIRRRDLKITATGLVPGSVLNQFSLDEYKNNLRISTTSGLGTFSASDAQVNDVYVLNSSLNTIGSVLDMGKGERIYSTRFMGDRGYVVTFKEIDPFYVLDLSNPKNPEMKGELKIPGYSSYLHEISNNIVVGIGKEGSNVKLSLFDVSSANDPSELDTLIVEDYSSSALSDHHAFLLDKKHEVFFLPGSSGKGYVVSYKYNKLVLAKTEEITNVVRAVYMDDYMYLVGREDIVVLDENNWDTVKKFKH